MPETNELPTSGIQANRTTIERSLAEISAQINTALIEADLVYPIYMCVPASGDALLTFACPVDPNDDEWNRVTQIVCDVVGAFTDKRLHSRPLSCAMAGTSMGAADLTSP
jgi:hypothetical protein